MKQLLSHHRLAVFIAFSLLLHAAWLTGQARQQRLFVPQQSGRLMSVHLRQQQLPVVKQQPPAPAQVRQAQAVNNEQAVKHTATRQQTASRQASGASVLARLHKKLAQRFVYPLLARRMGWQGRVLLGFRVDGSGSIQHVRIKQSSGYAVLDDSAMAALLKIGKIAIQTGATLPGSRQLEIPIIYRLEG